MTSQFDAFVYFILESYQDDIRTLLSYGGKLAEEETVGEYTIALLLLESEYHVALTRNNQSFMYAISQYKKSETNDLLKYRKKIETILRDWIRKYNVIEIGSFNHERTLLYKRVFSRAFVTGPIRKDGRATGFSMTDIL